MINRLQPTWSAEPVDLRFHLPPLRRDPPGQAGQWLGLSGAVLLSIGLWLPICTISVPLTIGELDSLYFLAVVALACVASLAAVRRAWVTLGLSGFLVYGTLAVAALHALHTHARAVPLMEVEVDFGCLVLVLGAALIVAGAAIGDYLTHRVPQRMVLPADIDFSPFPARPPLTAIQAGWELRN